MFDEQPDGDPHGECAAEIARLKGECDALRTLESRTAEHMQTVRFAEEVLTLEARKLRAEVERLRALFLPLSLPPELHESVHGPRYRCLQCGYAWMQEGKPQKHSADCAYVAARAALQESTP